MKETSRDYARPYRPRVVWCVDRLGGLLRHMGLGRPLRAESLLDSARRATGENEFGPYAGLEALERQVEAIEAEARLTTVGRFMQRQRLLGILGHRLRAEALFRAHPEILEAPLAAPIVIAGLQRTGTTFLHRLLAATPGARTLATWEALHPSPFPGDDPHGSGRRIRLTRQAEGFMRYVAPHFFAVHPMEAEAPEEDVLLLEMSFASQTAEATLHVPSFSRWLETQEPGRTYEDLRRWLQLLQWQRPGRRWVLKTPNHLEHLDALLRVFPGATIVQTHRDRTRATASFCSMVAHGRGVFSDTVDPLEIGAHWRRKIARLVDRSQRVREHNVGAFVDVNYDDLVADPVAVVKRVLAAAGDPAGAEVERCLAAAIASNVQHRFGRHVYDPADFGLADSPATLGP